ncbi:MAG TPA: MBL fold metallo-hydrolase [Herpetosiphonaceae bacterium]
MPRQVEIHHLDVGQGDSTLIVIKEMGPPIVLEKAVLIDAGLYNKGPEVVNYINNLGLAHVDLVIASHYDKDHFWGLRKVLVNTHARYNATHVYDRGEAGQVDHLGKVVGGRSDQYIDYLSKAGVRDAGKPPNYYVNTNPSRPNRRRPTTWANTDLATPPVPAGWAGRPNVPGNGYWRASNWLPRQADILQIPPNGPGDHPPTMVCIAANQNVRQDDNGNTLFVFGGMAIDDNPQSIGWLLRFNNFSYYTAGDLTIPQENQAALYTGQVSAFKLSHHGADTSTSQTFIDAINPRVAVISCGYNNSYGHPTQTIINRLQAKASIQHYFLTSCGANNALLPGCSGTNQWTANTKSRVSGSQAPVHPGHVIIRITEAQSLAATRQFSVRYYEDDLAGWATMNFL